MDFKEMVKYWANAPYIICDDVDKCGQCLKEKIKSEVSKEFLSLKVGNVETKDIVEIEKEIDRRFHETPLYKRVRSLLDQGQDLKKIAEDLSNEGIEI